MKRYRLIKKYPGSPELETILEDKYNTNIYFSPSEFPEFWEEVKEDISIITVDHEKIYGHNVVFVIKKGEYKLFEQNNGNTLKTWINGWYSDYQKFQREYKEPEEYFDAIKKDILERFLFFSSKEEAENWLILNTPCLSIIDVMKCYKNVAPLNSPLFSSLKLSLKMLVKSK